MPDQPEAAKPLGGMDRVLGAIKSQLLGIEPDFQFDQLDSTLNRISDAIVNKDALNYAEMLRSVFAGAFDKDFFKSYSGSAVMALGQEFGDRYGRYSNAEEICDSIPYCVRAIQVIADEIVAPDDITKESLQFMTGKKTDDGDRDGIRILRSINEMVGIDDVARDLIFETLKLGDQFVEICDYTSNEVPVTQSLLSETGELLGFSENGLVGEYEIDSTVLNEGADSYPVTVRPYLVCEGDSREGDKSDLRNIRLIIHDPRYIIKLQSERFKICLGYLALPKAPGSMSGLSGMKGQAFPVSGSQYSGLSSISGGSTNSSLIDKIYADLITNVKKYVGKSDILINHKEVKHLLVRCIKELEEDRKSDLKIRYIPPNRMEHLFMTNRRFFPYGESIFHKVTFQAKLLIAMETALSVRRISDSSDKRVIYVEATAPRNVRNLIEEIKETLKRRKFSVDAIGNIGSIPSMLTSYEDIYVPQTKGKRFVEFENLASTTNLRDVTDELRFLRDMLVAGLGVPPSYLNIEENLSNKSALSHENILFGRTIVSHQTHFSKFFNSLFQKINKLVSENSIPLGSKVTFAPPRFLEAEREAEHAELSSRLISTLAELGVNKNYLIKKYLSVDWEEVDRHNVEEVLNAQAKGLAGVPGDIDGQGVSGGIYGDTEEG